MATEKRLIERISERLKDAYPQADRNNLCPAIYYEDFAEIVDNVLIEIVESADAVEVVHGRWDKYTDEKFNGYDSEGRIRYRKVRTYYCDKCGHGSAVKSNYCPNCGADMRERKDNVL